MLFTHKSALALSIATGLMLGSQSASALENPLDKDDFTKEQLATVKVSMEEAIAKAKKAQPGTPIKVKMEHEDKTIKYEIEILNGDEEKEVSVNAITGEVEVEK